MRIAPLVLLCALAACALPAAANAANLRAGVGKADITPRTGYYLGGWTRADRVSGGQHTRLFSRAMVLERGGEKVALAQVDLFMVPGGMVQQIGDRLADRGLSSKNIIISASHTHSGPGGYGNFPTLNTAAPSLETATDPFSFFRLLNPSPADPELYRFLTDQIATAIARADDDLAPARAGWGSAQLLGLTQNRSLEAHLADHGIVIAQGEGKVDQDPEGYAHTIDPGVDVLRVDKVKGGRRIPIGAWSDFADHGTVTKSTFQFYNADHHASAERVFEQRVRRQGRVPRGQQVINVYGNGNEGDMSAGLTRNGPAASDYVGRVEAKAMLSAWRQAGSSMTATPEIASRWTRFCFCGQETEGGRVADSPAIGIPFLTGSEEGRGPLYDATGQELEGEHLPADAGPQGDKIYPPGADNTPARVPLVAVRVGSRMLVTVPGEATKEVGARIRADVEKAVAGSGIERIVIAGLANEFVLYFTTPEEYEQQHYEGGNTHFGEFTSNLLKEKIAQLAGTLAHGEDAPPPVEFDPTNGVAPTGPQYGDGAAEGKLLEQPAPAVPRLGHAAIAWQGGPQGLDRPVDHAFVVAQRRAGKRWVTADTDLGLAMLWKVDEVGRHDAFWEVPRNAPLGRYRLVVRAKRYRLVSRPFSVVAARTLVARQVPSARGHSAVVIAYPAARRDIDLTWRPRNATGGVVRFRVGSKVVRVKRRTKKKFFVDAPAGATVVVPKGAARDRFGNRNGAALTLRPPG